MAIQTLTLDPGAQSLEDQSIEVRNETGSGLAAGDLVYVTGWDEATSRWLIALSEAAPFGGNLSQFVLRSAIADVSDGQAHKSHRLTGQDTSGSAEGNPVYLSGSTPGGFSLIVPGFARQVVGRVAVVNAVTGEIEFLVLPDSDTGFIRTSPGSGAFPIAALQRNSGGLVDVDYDDVAAP